MSKYSVKGYVARDNDGALFFHTKRPKRHNPRTHEDNVVRYWMDGGYRFMLPEKMYAFMYLQWEDEPIKVTLSIES